MKKSLLYAVLLLSILAFTTLTSCTGSNQQGRNIHEDSLAMKEIYGDKPFELYPFPVGFTMKKKFGIEYESVVYNQPYCIDNFTHEYDSGWYITKVTKYWIYYRLERADEWGWE